MTEFLYLQIGKLRAYAPGFPIFLLSAAMALTFLLIRVDIDTNGSCLEK